MYVTVAGPMASESAESLPATLMRGFEALVHTVIQGYEKRGIAETDAVAGRRELFGKFSEPELCAVYARADSVAPIERGTDSAPKEVPARARKSVEKIARLAATLLTVDWAADAQREDGTEGTPDEAHAQLTLRLGPDGKLLLLELVAGGLVGADGEPPDGALHIVFHPELGIHVLRRAGAPRDDYDVYVLAGTNMFVREVLERAKAEEGEEGEEGEEAEEAEGEEEAEEAEGEEETEVEMEELPEGSPGATE
jgi:hypothetical protein